jgi:hypothetical protein
MNCYLDKHDIVLILNALDSYELDIEHGSANGHEYKYTVKEVQKLIKSLEKVLENNS